MATPHLMANPTLQRTGGSRCSPPSAERERSAYLEAVSNVMQLELAAESDSMLGWTSGTTSIQKLGGHTSIAMASSSRKSRTCCGDQWRIDRDAKARAWPWVGVEPGGICESSMCPIRFQTPCLSSQPTDLGRRR